MSDQFVKSRPLDGLKVCDATWYEAGPIATRALANLGADVIRIETEKRPDDFGLPNLSQRGKKVLIRAVTTIILTLRSVPSQLI